MDDSLTIQAELDNYRVPYVTLVTFLAENNYLGKSHSVQVNRLRSHILETFQIDIEKLLPSSELKLRTKISTFISRLRKRNRKQSHHIDKSKKRAMVWSRSDST